MQTAYDFVCGYCLNKKGVTEEYPFGPDALVFKVMGKMFALINEGSAPLRINLKCDPDDALALRAEYKAIIPGYHMNKRHWNTLILDNTIPEDILTELIDHSYELVVKGLKSADRENLLGGLAPHNSSIRDILLEKENYHIATRIIEILPQQPGW